MLLKFCVVILFLIPIIILLCDADKEYREKKNTVCIGNSGIPFNNIKTRRFKGHQNFLKLVLNATSVRTVRCYKISACNLSCFFISLLILSILLGASTRCTLM